jgi:hypothetical protein
MDSSVDWDGLEPLLSWIRSAKASNQWPPRYEDIPAQLLPLYQAHKASKARPAAQQPAWAVKLGSKMSKAGNTSQPAAKGGQQCAAHRRRPIQVKCIIEMMCCSGTLM